jgi:hypothetical protein
MDHQTSVTEANGAEVPPGQAIRLNMADFAHSLTTLAELQGQLLVLDARQTARHLVAPITLAVLGGILGLGCVPVVLTGIAYLLISLAEWSFPAAFLVTGCVALLIAAGLAVTAWLLLRKDLTTFDRSRVELARNLTWLKQVLKNSGRSWKSPVPPRAEELRPQEYPRHPR